MRKFVLIASAAALALSACSVFENPHVYHGGYDVGQSGDYGHSYDGQPAGNLPMNCPSYMCGSAGGYSVADSNYGHDTAGYGHSQYVQYGHNAHGFGQDAYGYGQRNMGGHASGYGAQGYGPQGYGASAQGAYGVPSLRGGYGKPRGAFYGTLGGIMYDTDLDSFGLQGRAGWDSGWGLLGATYGAEVEGSIGLTDENIGDFGGLTDVSSGFDHNYGAYVISRVPVSQRFSLHSRVGYSAHEFSTEGTDANGDLVKDSVKVDGLAIGLGVEYAISPATGLRLDYTHADTDLDGALEGFSASLVKKF